MSFCVLPWVHAYVRADGSVTSCCMSSEPVGSLRSHTLDQLWNAPGLKALRRAMLDGKKPSSCAGCHAREAVGMPSLRQESNVRFARHLGRRDLTREDGSLDEPFTAFLDIRFSNLCNLRCRICGPALSTAWRADALALGMDVPAEEPVDLWPQLEARLDQVEEVSFAGGEPLLMDAHDRLLEALRPDVKLLYNTNLTVLRDVIPLWRRFSKVSVIASADAAGKRGEVLRAGLSWETFLANAERVLREAPHVNLRFQTVLSAHNAGHLPELHAALPRVEGRWTIQLLTKPAEYSAQVLPRALREEFAAGMRRYASGLKDADAAELRGAADHMLAADQEHLLKDFWASTRALDGLRGEDFAKVFPELGAAICR